MSLMRYTLQFMARRRTLLRDLFTDSNGTLLTAHTMDVGSGWTLLEGATAPNINNNRARSANQSPATVVASAGVTDLTAEVEVALGAADASHAVGLVFHQYNSQEYWFIALDGTGEFAIYERSGGANYRRAYATVAVTLGQFALLRVVANGNSVRAWFAGGSEIAYSSSFVPGSLGAGLRFVSSDAVNNQADNLLVVTP